MANTTDMLEDYLYCTERRPVKKEGVGYGIDETPAWVELSKALAAREYKLLRLEPATSDIFLIKVQDTKPIDRKLGTVENPIHPGDLDGSCYPVASLSQ